MRSKPKPKPRRRLTDKERKFLEARISGLNMKQAAIAAGYTPNNPDVAAQQAQQSLEKKVPDLLARHGLDDDNFIKKYLVPALNATERKIFQHNGRLIYSKPQIPWNARNTANALVARIMGLIKEEQSQAPAGVKVLIVNGAYRPPRRPQSNGNPPENRAPDGNELGRPQEPDNGN